jgi:hypothetical protein
MEEVLRSLPTCINGMKKTALQHEEGLPLLLGRALSPPTKIERRYLVVFLRFMQFFVYILWSESLQKTDVGYTSNLVSRVRAHNLGMDR